MSPSDPANAVVISPFTASYNTQINGGVVFAQNNSLSCDGVKADGSVDLQACSNTKAGSKILPTNNGWRMNHVDIDTDPMTFNSTASVLQLPEGARVQYAALYWGARLRGADGMADAPPTTDRVKLKSPASTSYIDIVANPSDVINVPGAISPSRPYQAKAIVTDIVRSAGAGTYTVANIAAGLGNDRYAGWTLAVVFQDPKRPLRDITLFDGMVGIRSSDPSETITVSGFTTPVSGPVDATVGIVAYDGDRGNTGDFASFNSTRLASTISPSNDYFNSTIDTFGSNVTSRTPADQNTLGFDVKVADATGLLANGSTSAQIGIGTGGETVFVGLISTRIDLRAPRFPAVKSVVNLNGNNPAVVGDILQYDLSFTNTGDDPADRFSVMDTIPNGTSFVSGSLRINNVMTSDTGGDDLGEVNSTATAISARLGTGATATTGGRIDIGATQTVSFQVEVIASAQGTNISNFAELSYRGATINKDVQGITNTVTYPVLAADGTPPPPVSAPNLFLSIVVPERVIPGSNGVGQLVINNNGTSAANNTVVEYIIPKEFSVTEFDSRCALSTAVLKCSLPALDIGQSEVFSFSFSVAPSATGDVISQATATATSAQTSTSSGKTAISSSADLALRKTMTSRTTSSATFQMTVTNKGPSTATGVVISDVLPPGMVFASSKRCVPDTANNHVINCNIRKLENGATASVTLEVRLTSSLPMTNEATVSYSGLDRNPKNNTATAITAELPATGSPTTASLLWAFVLIFAGYLTHVFSSSARRRYG
jgi:large repetitive protein